MAAAAWTLDQTRILTLNQVKRVLEDLERRSRRYRSTLTNLAVFRLATCCGLRVSEISQLELRDLKLTSQRPHIHVRKGVGKGGKARKVPLWWDAGTLAFLQQFMARRVQEEASGSSLLICSTSVQSFGNRLDRMNLSRRFKQAIKVLGPDCCSSIHDGRHSFASIALAAGRTLPEVRDALGHRNISTTSVYLHALDDGTVGSIFE